MGWQWDEVEQEVTTAVNIAAGQSKEQTIAALRQAMAAQSGGTATGATFGLGEALPVPEALENTLAGAVRKGAVSVIEQPGAVLAGLIAEVTKTGHVALVGLAEQGLLSVVELGGKLSNIVCVPDPGMQPLEVIGLLADGVDLVVASLARTPPPSQARPLQARLRTSGCALVFVGQQWPGAAAEISSSVAGVSGLGTGYGRIRAVDYQVSVSGTRFPRRQCRWRVGEQVEQNNVVAFPAQRRS
ncbi:hypothetical protein QP923_05025 [Corynebacterium sp. MSK151]|uniref:hypothetical protein n=1 Tax=Corynebacterium TaxID=1716 RepID=UPI001CCBE451|nr:MULTISPECIES: hypothetical protein [Corynebacterium]MCA0443062.1 hypothetical protein [Corynebacterium amycolatum]MDC7118765.1 hypothetical protein [Corynebacterium amycolatum]MDK8758958.1 hypothetical protein [Corynebacterium sp. MSK151]MDK8809704.1 hypothetical protein [Corynebacterium sp. MSK035]MDK8848059.1 hypothetical protein [Corynebacterium sp. MSK047]